MKRKALFAAVAAALLVISWGCTFGRTPIGADQDEPISETEFPIDATKLLVLMGCKPERPEAECHSGKSVVSQMDTSALRQHAWMVFAGITAPSSTKLEGQSHFLARWQTWFPGELVFAPGDSGYKARKKLEEPFNLSRPRQLLGDETASDRKGPSVLSRVYYNSDLYHAIRDDKYKYYDSKTLTDLLAAKEQVRLPRSSIAVKTVWALAKQNECTWIGVWNGVTGKPEGVGFRWTDWPYPVPVETSHGACNLPNAVSSKTFYDFILRSEDLDGLTRSGFKDAKAGDSALLLGLHLTTRELSNWVWASFWWHDHSHDGPFAADRPRAVKTPWDSYLMDVSYDFDRPYGHDGMPKIAFNPYLEGAMPRGTVSNCMTCHSRAFWPAQGPPAATMDLQEGHEGIESIVVRGKDAASRTYLPKTDTFLRTDFLWGFQRVQLPTAVKKPNP